MPEGDTIHRAASTLDRALTGRALTAFRADGLGGALPGPGTTVRGVEARGKHLLIRFDDGLTLHTHMRMEGSWHLYRPGERWRKARASARVVLETEEWVAVCFSAPIVEVVRDERRLASVRSLGPDLTAPDPDLDEALTRMAATEQEREIGEVLLDQRIAAGIGNVYKSEVLHLERISPFTPLSGLEVAARRRLLERAAALLRRNLTTVRRTTVAGGLAVYGRAGRPCRRCGSTIRRRLQGRERPRATFWCPACQPSAA